MLTTATRGHCLIRNVNTDCNKLLSIKQYGHFWCGWAEIIHYIIHILPLFPYKSLCFATLISHRTFHLMLSYTIYFFTQITYWQQTCSHLVSIIYVVLYMVKFWKLPNHFARHFVYFNDYIVKITTLFPEIYLVFFSSSAVSGKSLAHHFSWAFMICPMTWTPLTSITA